MKSFFCNKYLIFILAFFSPMIIDIGGEVSPSFLFIVATSPFWVKNLDFKAKTPFRYIVRLFAFLLTIQCIWALFAETAVKDQVRGILITVSGLFYFMYYYMVYSRNRDVVKWDVLGRFIASFVFVSVMAERNGTDFGLWKFQVMPRLVEMCALIYLWSGNKLSKYSPLLFVFIGALGIATGARSTGLVPFMTGIIVFLLQWKKRINLKQIKTYLLGGTVVLYAAYALIYVPTVLGNSENEGNADQMKKMENPYNPIGLLMIGRSDSMVPFMAFFDKPLIGWGYAAPDPNLHYNILMSQLSAGTDEEQFDWISRNSIIPSHSGWGYLSCSYGICGFLVIFFMLRKTLSVLYQSLVVYDKYLLYRIFIMIGFLWNILFSPLAHFKTSPSDLAIVIVFSLAALKGLQGNNENIENKVRQ